MGKQNKLKKSEKALLEDDSKNKMIEFTITISGVGRDIDECWNEAISAIAEDPGVPDDNEIVSVEEAE